MPSAAELRAELKEMRKSHPDHMPVSKMHKKDVAATIERMRAHLEASPSIAQDSSPAKAPARASVESVKDAKAAEFPVAPAKSAEKKAMAPKMSHKEPKAGKVSSKAPEKGVKEMPAPAAKESMSERMARIRAMKGKAKAKPE